jgi:hypothetical protein
MPSSWLRPRRMSRIRVRNSTGILPGCSDKNGCDCEGQRPGIDTSLGRRGPGGRCLAPGRAEGPVQASYQPGRWPLPNFFDSRHQPDGLGWYRAGPSALLNPPQIKARNENRASRWGDNPRCHAKARRREKGSLGIARKPPRSTDPSRYPGWSLRLRAFA